MFTIRQTANGWELVDPDGHVVQRGDLATLVAAVEAPAVMHWTGVITVEGRMTGDGRGAESGAWGWETPFPLTWQREGGSHDGAVTVGIVWEVWRDGDLIHGTGTFDLGSEEGREAARHVAEGLTRDVSIEPDSVDVELRVAAEVVEAWEQPMDDEFVEDAPERETDDEGRVILDRIHHDDTVEVVTAGRIRTLAMVTTAAYDEATIDLAAGVTLESLLEGQQAPSPDADGLAARTASYEAEDDDEADDPADALGTVHAELDAAEGALGGDEPNVETALEHIAAADRATSEAEGLLGSERAANAETDDDHDATVARIASAFDVPVGLIAAAAPARPPAAWFDDPELEGPTPLTVDDDGRIFGHLATWGTCHIGRDDVCLTPPRSEAAYAYFTTGEVTADCGDCGDGDRALASIPTGAITLGTGHANLAARHQAAVEHYDNTGWAVGDVAAGEDEHGVWVAGALRPGVNDEQVRALRGSSLSGDWRRIAGNLELVAALAVNVPGFPIPRAVAASGAVDALTHARARADGDRTLALVAAGTVIPTATAPEPEAEGLTLPPELVRTLARIERTMKPQVAASLRREVHGDRPTAAELRRRVHGVRD